MERHCVSRRSRRQKGIPAFRARDADARPLVYANARVRKGSQNDGVLRFIEFREERNGGPPRELVFDSRLTTHASPARIDAMGIDFLTLRRRSGSPLDAIAACPESDWKQVRLTNVGRMVIENAIADAIDLFHMDALSAAVPMKVDPDLQLTLMASGLYRLLAVRPGNGRRNAKARTPSRNFVKAPADVTISDGGIDVRLGRRANNPFLLNASYDETNVAVPWLGNRRLRISFL